MLVREAIRGTMGAEKLARIFANNDIQVGRTSIKAHREEGHS